MSEKTYSQFNSELVERIQELEAEEERLHNVIAACDGYIDELHDQIIALTADTFRLRKDEVLYNV